jgi:hypothetical protein
LFAAVLYNQSKLLVLFSQSKHQLLFNQSKQLVLFNQLKHQLLFNQSKQLVLFSQSKHQLLFNQSKHQLLFNQSKHQLLFDQSRQRHRPPAHRRRHTWSWPSSASSRPSSSCRCPSAPLLQGTNNSF